MNEPTTLLETTSSARTRALLQAGRADAPPHGFSDRLLIGLGLAAAASSVTISASAGAAGVAIHGAASTGGGAASLALLGAKWVAVGVLGGGILAGGAELAFSPTRPPRAAVKSSMPARAAPPVTAPARGPRETAVEVPEAELSVVPSEPQQLRVMDVPGAPASVEEQAQLGREVAAIDRARRALAAGNPARALLELDALERQPQTRVLDREAEILRIEALYKTGQTGRARQLAEQYLQAFPNDAHAARLRALEQDAAPR